MDKLIGRKNEYRELDDAFRSSRSELVLLRGRRRVGKTFLVRSYFQDRYTFHFVGRYKKKKAEQLEAFRQELQNMSDFSVPVLSTWKDAFRALETFLEQSTDERKIIFLDELPWMDRNGNELIDELEDFWNTWVTNRDDIVLIACGSATAWMRKKFEKNRGGLHRRITRKIYLRPFFLGEVKEYLYNHEIRWDDYQILQCYMIFGGVPYYLSLLRPNLSLPENVDYLLFRRGSELEDEFDELFPALFNKAEKYIQIVRLLSSRRIGFSRKEIQEATHISGGTLTTMLENLEDSDFINGYAQFGNKDKNTIYRLQDMFILFHFQFIQGNNSKDEQYWSHHYGNRNVETWEGFTFEQLCLLHLPLIKMGLGISGVATHTSSWRYIAPQGSNHNGAQIDMVIKRADGIIHLVEMKFSKTEYEITKDYANRLQERSATFMAVTGVKHGIMQTFITPFGLKRNACSSSVLSQLTSEDLFKSL